MTLKAISDIFLTKVLNSADEKGIILENKVLKKLKFSKNDNNKKHTLKLILFNEKKN